MKYFRGSELQSTCYQVVATVINKRQDYFTKVLEDDLKAVVKPQYVDQIPKAVKAGDKTVAGLMKARLQMNNFDEVVETLGTSMLSLRWSSQVDR